MKILSIRIKNLASLAGEHFIDFESDPLASAGLIAIVGKTGAGKSTILDAMCLALFNKIPRLKDSDGKLTDVDGSELLTNSPLTVLRRGTAHGFAELCFIAQDQKRYLARWEIKRSREKADGKLQSVQRYLKCLTDSVVVADKTKAVDDSIKKISQLSFEQFTRAVLLAQSEVTAFLKARDNERGELLEYLTNSNIFGKIGQLAYEKTKQIANQRKEIENVLGHIEIMSDEDFSSIQMQYNENHAQFKKLETEKSHLEKQHQWFEQKHKLEADVQQYQQYFNIQQQQFAQLAPQRSQLKQLETFASIRSSVLQQHKIQIELNSLQPQIQKTEQQFLGIQQNFETKKNQFQKADEQLKTQHQFEQTHQQRIEKVRVCIQEREFIGQQFKKAQAALLQLQNDQHPLLQQQKQLKLELDQLKIEQQQQLNQLEKTVQFQSLDDGLSAHIVQLQRFIHHYQEFEQHSGDVVSAQAQLSAKQNELKNFQSEFGNEEEIHLKLQAYRQNREQKSQQIHALGLAQNQFKQYLQVRLESDKLNVQNQQLNQNIDQSKKQLQLSEQQYLSHKQERENLQRILQQQRLLHTENIEKLREQLIDGEACLVCGSRDHPYKQNHHALSHELLILQEQQEQQAIQLEKDSFDAWQKVQLALTQQETALNETQKRVQNLEQSIQQLETPLQQALNQAQIQIDLEQINDTSEHQIAEKLELTRSEIIELEKGLNQLDQVQKDQRALTQYIQQTSQQLSIIQQAEHNIQYILDIFTVEQKLVWKQQPRSMAEKINQDLNQRLRHLQHSDQMAKDLSEKNNALAQLEQQIAFKADQIKATEIEKTECERKGQDNKELAVQLIFEMSQIQVDRPHEWLAQYDENRKILQEQFNQGRQHFDLTRQQFDTQQRQLDQLKMQQQRDEAQLNAYALEIQQWLNQHPDFNLEVIQQLRLVSNEQEQQLKISVQQAERNLADAQSTLNAIQGQLKQHITAEPNIDFAQLQTQLSALLVNLQQVQEIRDGFKLKIEVHQQNIEKQKKFATQIQEIQQEEHRWGKISGLMGDSTGKKFRDYAQQYNLDILIEHANQQLSMLSQRYTLKRLDNSLSLAIIDHDMDGEMRSVSSLSGGESFLTALALSLAIANMASGSMKIESLFIDEGFGTLDASSLHMVMNALDQLQSQGRKVVLISHIQEMHERIPVQIQVKPLGAGASTIEVVS